MFNIRSRMSCSVHNIDIEVKMLLYRPAIYQGCEHDIDDYYFEHPHFRVIQETIENEIFRLKLMKGYYSFGSLEQDRHMFVTIKKVILQWSYIVDN
jgi:hypothetical protein